MGLEPSSEITLKAEQQNKDKAGNYRRYRKRNLYQDDQQVFAEEFELRDGPRRDQAKGGVCGDRDRSDDKSQPNCGESVGIAKRREIGRETLGERRGEHDDKRQDYKDAEERGRQPGYCPLHPRWIGISPALGVDFRAHAADAPSALKFDVAHGQHAQIRRPVFSSDQRCKRLIRKSRRKDAISMTTAMAVASA